MNDAELTLLAICLQCDDVSVALQHGVTADWFSTFNNKKLWSGMMRRKENGKTVDLIWVQHYIADNEFVQTLSNTYTPMKNPTAELCSAIEILQHRYLARKAQDIMFAYLVDRIKTNDPFDAIDHTIQQLADLRNPRQLKAEVDVTAEIKRRVTSDLTIGTGYQTLDKMTRGIEPSVWLIGGFPQVGKTTFVTNITLNVAEQGHPVVIFSGELDKVKLYEKLAIMISGFNPYSGICADKQNEFMRCVESVEDLSLAVIEDLSLTRIITEIQKRKALLYVVDYLQLIHVNKRFESREREVNYIIQELAHLKQINQVCIMAISSFNRRNWGEIPTLANLKDSGSLEYASDYVLLLDKPIRRLRAKALDEAKKMGRDCVIKGSLAKNRYYGIEGSLSLRLDKQSLRIRENMK